MLPNGAYMGGHTRVDMNFEAHLEIDHFYRQSFDGVGMLRHALHKFAP